METRYTLALNGIFTAFIVSAIIFALTITNVYRKPNFTFYPKLKPDNIDINAISSKWKIYNPQSNEEKLQKVVDIGVFATAVGYKNMAIVSIDGKKVIVKEGDIIEGIKVLNITKSDVEFFYNGDKKKVKIGYMPPSKNSTAQSANIGSLPPLESILPPTSKVLNTIPKSELERLTADPGVMFTQIRLIPSVENGQTKGFRFDWIAEGSLFQKMGINVGDVLVSINNQAINSGEDAFRILQIIRNEKSFKVSIIRNGRPLELNYTVE